jgi:hypothetical protein
MAGPCPKTTTNVGEGSNPPVRLKAKGESKGLAFGAFQMLCPNKKTKGEKNGKMEIVIRIAEILGGDGGVGIPGHQEF